MHPDDDSGHGDQQQTPLQLTSRGGRAALLHICYQDCFVSWMLAE